MDSFFRIAAAINFPSPSSCSQAAMLVGRAGCVHPGWFSAIAFYTINHGHHPYAVKHTFYSDSYGTNAWINSDSGSSSGSSRSRSRSSSSSSSSNSSTNSSICPFVNKWRCAFLATTNCSEPDMLRNCSKGEKCVASNNLANSVLFTNASRVGQIVAKNDLAKYGKVPFNNVSWPQQLPIVLSILPYSKTIGSSNSSSSSGTSTSSSTSSSGTSTSSSSSGSSSGSSSSSCSSSNGSNSTVDDNRNSTVYHTRYDGVDSLSLAVKYSLILRQSALYRRAVAAEIASFRRDNPLLFRRDENGQSAGPPPCVTAHLRRGDRAIKGLNVNYTEYCYNMTHNLPCLGGRCNRSGLIYTHTVYTYILTDVVKTRMAIACTHTYIHTYIQYIRFILSQYVGTIFTCTWCVCMYVCTQLCTTRLKVDVCSVYIENMCDSKSVSVCMNACIYVCTNMLGTPAVGIRPFLSVR